MNAKIAAAVLFLVFTLSRTVFARSIDSRDFYEINYKNNQYLHEDAGSIQYDNGDAEFEIILAGDGVNRDEFVRQIDLEPMEKLSEKLPEKARKSLCVGSVTLMAQCF